MFEKEYILENIKLLDNNTITLDKLIETFCDEITRKYNVNKTPELETYLKDILTKYQNKEITIDELITKMDEIKVTYPTSEPTVHYSSGSYHKKEEPVETVVEETEDVVDIDTDVIQEAALELQTFEEEVNNVELTIPQEVSSYTADISASANNARNELNNLLEKLKTSMVTTLTSVEGIDQEIGNFNVSDASFTKIANLAYDVKLNSKARVATREFFKNGGCTISGDFAILRTNGKEYKYDMKENVFYVNGNPAFETTFYVPTNTTDYSKLNTYTFFAAPNYKNIINDRNINSVVAKIIKFSESKPFNKFSEVADLTKFTNAIAKTDLSRCQNSIGGDSVYGAYSLQIAAGSGNLYDSVYCVNNAALVTNLNAHPREKAQFSSLEELKKLNGKKIYFVSSSGDQNLNSHYGKDGAMTTCAYSDGYTYTGIKLLSENCPDAEIHMVYKPANSTHQKLADLFIEYDKKRSNFTYNKDWDDFARKRYASHSDGQILIADLSEAPSMNANVYNSRA